MKESPNQAVPDEETIEELLKGIKPQPTLHFYSRMETAPWNRTIHSTKRVSGKTNLSLQKAAVGLLIILLLVVIGAYAFLPSARATADQIIHFFLPSNSNQLEVRLTPSGSPVMLDFANPDNFTLSVEELRSLAKFQIVMPGAMPANLTFIGGRYEPSYNAAITLYEGKNYMLFFTQRPVGNGQDVFSIGEDARIETVLIGYLQGEYVLGGWKSISVQTTEGIVQPTGTGEIIAVWDDQLPQSTLRWQSGGMAFELRTSGSKIPPQSELIEFANGLK